MTQCVNYLTVSQRSSVNTSKHCAMQMRTTDAKFHTWLWACEGKEPI